MPSLTYMPVCINACVCTHTCISACVCTYTCVCQCVHIHVCRCMCVYIYTCVSVHVCTCVCRCMCVHIHVCIGACTYIYMHTHMYTCFLCLLSASFFLFTLKFKIYNFIIDRAYFHLKSPSLSRSQNRFLTVFFLEIASYKMLLNSSVIPKKF